jgi:hypothetical protein
MDNFSGQNAAGYLALTGPDNVSAGDLASAVRELEGAALDVALIRLEESLNSALRNETLGSRLLMGFALTVFISAAAYGLLFEAMTFLTRAIWPSMTAASGHMASHGIIFLVAILCLFWRRVTQYGRAVADATH